MMFASVSDVQLEFSQGTLTMEQTIAIAGRMKNTVEIPEDLTALKRSKVETIASSTANRYQQAGVIPRDTGNFMIQYCQPILCYGLENQSNVFWSVHYGSRDGAGLFLMLIDDRTGTVCSVEYTDAQSEYLPDEYKPLQNRYCHTHGQNDHAYSLPLPEEV